MVVELLEAKWSTKPANLIMWTGECVPIRTGDIVKYYYSVTEHAMYFVSVEHKEEEGSNGGI